MASKRKPRKRDYQAEYARRLERGRQKGLTTAQARRGAIKYAQAPPREHIQRERTAQERYGLTSREVTRTRAAARHTRAGEREYTLQRFHSIDRAMDFAAGLPARTNVYLAGRGQYRLTTQRYQQGTHGWAVIQDLAYPNVFSNSAAREAMRAEDERIFDPHASTYEVRSAEPR